MIRAILLIAACALSIGVIGKPQRSAAEVLAFKRAVPCPSTGERRGACPGHVIDHVIPLACDGRDHRSNMQWQTIAEGKAKDKWERKACGK